jgi:hypothetical protein
MDIQKNESIREGVEQVLSKFFTTDGLGYDGIKKGVSPDSIINSAISLVKERAFELEKENLELRILLWMNHNPQHFPDLYGDDGELQCKACKLDFKRDSPKTMAERWEKLNLQKLLQSIKSGNTVQVMKQLEKDKENEH